MTLSRLRGGFSSVRTSVSTSPRVVAANQRNYGSLHQDVWETSGAELASTGKLAVYPVGGWWKNAKKRERIDQPVRYSLVVFLKTEATDIDVHLWSRHSAATGPSSVDRHFAFRAQPSERAECDCGRTPS